MYFSAAARPAGCMPSSTVRGRKRVPAMARCISPSDGPGADLLPLLVLAGLMLRKRKRSYAVAVYGVRRLVAAMVSALSAVAGRKACRAAPPPIDSGDESPHS